MNGYRLIDEEAAKAVCEQLSVLEWKEGRARTDSLTGTVKQNLEILPEDGIQKTMAKNLANRILGHTQIQRDHLPLQLHAPKFSKYTNGGHYKDHTDAPWMGDVRTDLACTVWLNDDYEGGELCVGGKMLKGKPGECVVYECGQIHHVNPVTKGERICAIAWIQSRVRDPMKRQIVSNLRSLLSKFETDHQDWFLEGAAVHSALLRRWSE